LSLVVETGDSIRDGAGESVGIGEGTIGQIMLLEVAPASFDVVQLIPTALNWERWLPIGGFRSR
jgi:hypothetical protein